SYGVGVKIDGDLATVGFDLPNGWGVHGAAQAQQLVQQIVYTATEETGIRRVLVVENGKTTATIDQLVVNRPLTRDDVSGYAAIAQTGTTEFEGSTKLPNVTGDVVSREIVDGTLVRYTFVGSDRAHNATKTDLPPFAISFQRNDGSVPHNTGDGAPPAYLLTIAFHVNATGEFGAVGHVERVDRSPLRLVTSSDAFVQLGLDDARPWRAYEPDPQHLIVEIGGDPRTVSDRIAVASPAPASAAQRSFTLSGLARTFEANVVWRVKDASGKIVANGHTTASIGTSVFWGTFSAPVTLPSSVSGNVTLEVYEVSPKDGTEQGVVSVPLVIR
ncbi:MAG TPA: Gmad2 immunoglobulin-like domain-containing protein, partial [Candidatus Limnocylindria bacterium]